VYVSSITRVGEEGSESMVGAITGNREGEGSQIDYLLFHEGHQGLGHRYL
jgi:hypothetical protein